jgi:hypothetical protein
MDMVPMPQRLSTHETSRKTKKPPVTVETVSLNLPGDEGGD